MRPQAAHSPPPRHGPTQGFGGTPDVPATALSAMSKPAPLPGRCGSAGLRSHPPGRRCRRPVMSRRQSSRMSEPTASSSRGDRVVVDLDLQRTELAADERRSVRQPWRSWRTGGCGHPTPAARWPAPGPAAAECSTTRTVPGGRSAAAEPIREPPRPYRPVRGFQDDDPLSANSDGLRSSASSLVETSPARSRFTGTSSVPAVAGRCEGSHLHARSTRAARRPEQGAASRSHPPPMVSCGCDETRHRPRGKAYRRAPAASRNHRRRHNSTPAAVVAHGGKPCPPDGTDTAAARIRPPDAPPPATTTLPGR